MRFFSRNLFCKCDLGSREYPRPGFQANRYVSSSYPLFLYICIHLFIYIKSGCYPSVPRFFYKKHFQPSKVSVLLEILPIFRSKCHRGFLANIRNNEDSLERLFQL